MILVLPYQVPGGKVLAEPGRENNAVVRRSAGRHPCGGAQLRSPLNFRINRGMTPHTNFLPVGRYMWGTSQIDGMTTHTHHTQTSYQFVSGGGSL